MDCDVNSSIDLIATNVGRELSTTLDGMVSNHSLKFERFLCHLIITVRVLLKDACIARSESGTVVQVQQVGLTRPHHTCRRRLREPLTSALGPLPMTIHTTKLVTDMAVKKGVNSLLSQISGSIGAAARADGNIGQLEATLTLVESVVFVASLQITDNQVSPRTMVRVVSKRLHRLAPPTFLIRNPSIIRSELCKVTNQWFDQVLRPPNRMDIPPCNENSFVTRTNVIPVLSILNGPVCHIEIRLEKVGF
mmetsp:Transcript_34001/g.61092  ORF Transcript_34001/g.61092 Transcript_34001/m.61092 type:complete len:250 (-) Transcript_34001:430-1179(-)